MRLFFVFFSFIISEYKTGMKKSVMKVELVKPPTTATPIGWTMPALPLEAKHIGSIPKIVVKVICDVDVGKHGALPVFHAVGVIPLAQIHMSSEHAALVVIAEVHVAHVLCDPELQGAVPGPGWSVGFLAAAEQADAEKKDKQSGKYSFHTDHLRHWLR